LKHVRLHKALVAMLRVKMEDHYFSEKQFHVANEKLYLSKGFETMLQQITMVQFKLTRKKICAICFNFPLAYSWSSHDKLHNNAKIVYLVKCS
jgi:hypothetical protein